MGNAVVAIPSERAPLVATDFYQVLDTSDVPAGVVNIVTGDKMALAVELAKHDAVDGIWWFGDAAGAAAIEKASAGNLKQSWTETFARDWHDAGRSQGRDILQRATQVKNIWIPYGE
jgi:aldehyde dehydrogenase (NAD+)